jgi:hypothetical protein
VTALLKQVRAAVEAWEDAPQWMYEAAGDVAMPLAVAMDALGKSLAAHEAAGHEARRPATLGALPAWYASHPDGNAWAFPLPSVAAGALDGHGCIVVDQSNPVPPCTKNGWGAAEDNAKRIDGVFKTLPNRGSVTIGTLRTWLDASYQDGDTPTVVVGSTVLSADLVRLWILAPLEISGAQSVEVSWGGALEQTQWYGTGWRGAVMPRRSEAGSAPLEVGT